MKRLFSVVVSAALFLTGCGKHVEELEQIETAPSEEVIAIDHDQTGVVQDLSWIDDEEPDYDGLNDYALLQDMEDNLYSQLDSSLNDDYQIENVAAIYVSKEYIEESAYNKKKNIYFGYTLEELDESFRGKQYIFTLGDDGTTVVRAVETDELFDDVVKNVAIGTGVILVCVTVSCLTAGLAGPVSIIFATSAKAGATAALSGAAMSGATTAIVKAFTSNDPEEIKRAVILSASQGYKIGAIAGVITGGVGEAIKQFSNASEMASGVGAEKPSWSQSEKDVCDMLNGESQKSYLNGQEVPYGTPGSTRPDVIHKVSDTLNATEVKNYKLDKENLCNLIFTLRREVADRVANLPPGSTQSIYLDVRHRLASDGLPYSDVYLEYVTEFIQNSLSDIYPNIPVQILR